MSGLPTEVLEVRSYPGGGREVASVDDETQRYSLWTGPAPSPTPRHPALGRLVGAASCEGSPVWLEDRASGPLLSEVETLGVETLARVMLDLASGLAALHGSGLSHGAVGPDRVVLRPSGGAQLFGASTSGSSRADVTALREWMLTAWPGDAPAPPDPGPDEPASVLAESLEGWLAWHLPDTQVDHRPPPGPTVPEMALVLILEPVPEISHLDEVVVDLGPEPAGETSTGSGTVGGLSDHTRPASARFGASPRRQDLVGRLSAFADARPDPERFGDKEGRPSNVIKGLIADEPLDPLPLPDGVPPLGQALDPPVIHEVERTATGDSTATRVTALTEIVSRRALGITLAGSVIVITGVGALVWLLLQS